ncbi:MAG: 50S ribosomal protein L33 [Candidatus Ratteibacteria bacterium]|nr:50S ribosomal protein L33 [Candidatus Ratteibacteria bacterium]
MREIIVLACSQCKRRNYTQTRNKRTHPAKLEIKKFCNFCRKRVLHKEVK